MNPPNFRQSKKASLIFALRCKNLFIFLERETEAKQRIFMLQDTQPEEIWRVLNPFSPSYSSPRPRRLIRTKGYCISKKAPTQKYTHKPFSSERDEEKKSMRDQTKDLFVRIRKKTLTIQKDSNGA